MHIDRKGQFTKSDKIRFSEHFLLNQLIVLSFGLVLKTIADYNNHYQLVVLVQTK